MRSRGWTLVMLALALGGPTTLAASGAANAQDGAPAGESQSQALAPRLIEIAEQARAEGEAAGLSPEELVQAIRDAVLAALSVSGATPAEIAAALQIAAQLAPSVPTFQALTAAVTAVSPPTVADQGSGGGAPPPPSGASTGTAPLPPPPSNGGGGGGGSDYRS